MKAPMDVARITPELIERARRFSAATLHEASGRTGVLPHEIVPAFAGARLCGPAVTVQSPGGDNLWIHRAIYAARPGDVLVVDTGGAHAFGYWGEIMSTAAASRALGGLWIDGCVRDRDLLEAAGVPIFSRGFCIRGTGKDLDGRGAVHIPVLLGDTIVRPGDLVVGDADGAVAIARERVADVLGAAAARETAEAKILERLRAGESTLSIYGWP
jgi:4-hydroxy-4-methyl-2-oxoglutarate aldolase